MKSLHPTQKDVARAAGVGRSTVSMALKDHPSIPRKTCEKIQKIAAQLGYIPDAMLSALAVYRNSRRTQTYQGTLAWLTNYTDPSRWSGEPYALYWRDNHPYWLYFEGATAQANARGYNLEAFELKSEGMTSERLASILHSRNIHGILVCPPPSSDPEIDFPWDRFSAITFGYSLTKPPLHRVGTSQYRAMVQTMRKVRERGYRRIAFAFSSIQDQRADHNYLAGYLAEQHLAGLEPLFPPVATVEDSPEEFRLWLRSHKPEVIVTGNENILRFLTDLGLNIPGDICVASAMLASRDGSLSGYYEGYVHVGEVAADFLISMLLRGERGASEFPQHLHVEGSWVEGKTLPARPQKKIRRKPH